jgi:hypothetical protein
VQSPRFNPQHCKIITIIINVSSGSKIPRTTNTTERSSSIYDITTQHLLGRERKKYLFGVKYVSNNAHYQEVHIIEDSQGNKQPNTIKYTPGEKQLFFTTSILLHKTECFQQ